jgi:REP element-mobilizing transposase RayT
MLNEEGMEYLINFEVEDASRQDRRSIRLACYDYSSAGAYFVTVCTHDSACLFGDIVNGELRLNAAGLMIQRWYGELGKNFSGIHCDDFVCMPNHVHFILINEGDASRLCPDTVDTVGADLRVRLNSSESAGMGEYAGPALHVVMQWFKTMTTNEYIRSVKQYGWLPFNGKLWQRNYWEHIVRDESELTRIREYIRNNPARWELDKYYWK